MADTSSITSNETLKSIFGDGMSFELPKELKPDAIIASAKKEGEAIKKYRDKESEVEKAQASSAAKSATELSAKYEPQFQRTPDFAPSEENKAALVGMFGLLGAIGAMGGGKSYGSALGAMNAMGGMLKGYQQGRKDLFEREKAEYDKHVQAVKSHNDEVTKAYARAQNVAKTNLAKADADLKSTLRSMGADMEASKVEREGISKAYESHIKAMNAGANAYKQYVSVIDKLNGGGAKRQFVTVDDEQKYLSDAEIIQAQTEGKTIAQTARPSSKGSDLKPSAAERKSYISLGNNITTAEKLKKMVDDPVFAAEISKYRWKNMFAEEGGKIASQLLNTNIPDNVREFIQLGSALRNAYYLDISGKAVTGGEAMRNYNVVPQPGDMPEVLRSKFKILIDKFNDDRSDYQEMYPQLPDFSKGTRTQTGSDEERQAKSAFGFYEPNKYEYGINPATGKFARTPKAQ
jgi:hypothetical protein